MDARRTNPRQKSNFLSKITFWYTLPLLIKGAKKELDQKDLYKVLPDYKSQILGDQIEHEWDRTHSIHLALWNLTGKYYLLLGSTKILEITIYVLRPVVISKFVSYFVPNQEEMTKTDLYLYSVSLVGLSFLDTLYRYNYWMLAESLGIKFRAAVSGLVYRKCLKLSTGSFQNVHFGKIVSLLTKDVAVFDLWFFQFNDSWTGCISVAIICWNMYKRVGMATSVAILALGVYIPCVVALGVKMASLKVAASGKTDARIHTLGEVLTKIRSTKIYVWQRIIERRVSEARRKEMSILFQISIFMFLILSIGVLTIHLTHYCVLMTCVWLGQSLTAETIFFVTSGFQTMAYPLTVGVPYTVHPTSQALAALKRIQKVLEELDSASRDPELPEPDFVLTPGLTLLFGPASVGKTRLLMALLQKLEGRISFAPQEPWLFPATIKDNVVFGAELDANRYNRVLQVSALKHDLNRLQNGDRTVVAEQGLNLSKGQQSRISLARAVYQQSDFYLIDDCFTNLDPLVTNWVFHKCIVQFLGSKLVVLVTRNEEFLPYARTVIRMDKSGVQVSRNDHPKASPPDQEVWEGPSGDRGNWDSSPEAPLLPKTENRVYDEVQNSGKVPGSVYKKYIQLGGGTSMVVLIFSVFLFGQICISYKDKLVSRWADLEQQIWTNQTSQDLKSERDFTLYVYTAVVVLIVGITMCRGFLLFLFSRRASLNLHKAMLKSLINATMRFFDRVFIGNILNRFSKDLVTIDESVPFTLLHIAAIVFETSGVLVLILLVNLTFLIPTLVLFLTLILLRGFYLRTGRALKRLEATAKSPVVGHVKSALQGLPTIRTSHAQSMLKSQFDESQDIYTSASFSNLVCAKAYAFAVDNLASILLTVAVLKILFFDQEVQAGEVGLTISQILMMCSIQHFLFSQLAELETQMTLAQRAFEYTSLVEEPKSGLVLEKWPRSGKIQFENVNLNFDNCKAVKNLNFVVENGEKIGVVGRTGAGKSSIISLIFRLYDFLGTITIDGVDIKTLTLDFLRSRISVIPQEALVFNGSLRYNLDPGNLHDDQQIWAVIGYVKLKHLFQSLDTAITEPDLSFSQKQLICLARILLDTDRRPILLLDEISEDLIYDLVDRHFQKATVIKISHKMRFVMDCDRVLVMDNGEIVEEGSPRSLVEKRGSLFGKMVAESVAIG